MVEDFNRFALGFNFQRRAYRSHYRFKITVIRGVSEDCHESARHFTFHSNTSAVLRYWMCAAITAMVAPSARQYSSELEQVHLLQYLCHSQLSFGHVLRVLTSISFCIAVKRISSDIVFQPWMSIAGHVCDGKKYLDIVFLISKQQHS